MKLHHFQPHIWFLTIFSLLTFIMVIALQSPLPNQFGKAQGIQSDVIEGTFQILHEHDIANQTSIDKYLVQRQDLSMVELTNQKKLNIAPGTKIKVHGKLSRSYTSNFNDSVSAETIEILRLPTQILPLTTGAQNIAVILANYSDSSANNIPTNIEAANFINSQIRNFFKENSYNKLTLTSPARAFGWYNLPVSSSTDMNLILQSAVRAADAQIDYNKYRLIIVVLPKRSETGGAFAYYPPGITLSTEEGDKALAVSVITGNLFNPYGLILIPHELGHNFGAGHSSGWECGAVSLASPDCVSNDAADMFDSMGYSLTNHGHFGGYLKELFRWLAPSNILTLAKSGVFNMYPLETIPIEQDLIQMLKIPLEGSNSYYSVENRTRSGFDSLLPGNAVSGALIKIIPKAPKIDIPNIIDSTPNINDTDKQVHNDFNNAGFLPGQTFHDSQRGIKITPLTKTNGILNVEVKFYGPFLTSPANGATSGPIKPYFSWKRIPASSNYRIQVAKDIEFKNIILDSHSPNSYFNSPIDLEKGVTYFWRVRASYSFGPSDWSEIFSFRIPNPAPAPTIIGPKNGITTASLQPTFKWNALSPAPPAIELQIASNSLNTKLDPFQSNLVYSKKNITGSVTQFTLPIALTARTQYLWRIRGLYSPDPSFWSSAGSFNTQ